MAFTTSALADLSFGLRFAASRYRRFARLDDQSANEDLFLALADERSTDAEVVDEVIAYEGIARTDPTIDDRRAGTVLGLGDGDPSSASSAAYRVQRAENTLGRMATQLESFANQGRIRMALVHVRSRIDSRRNNVREARRKAQKMEVLPGLATHGSSLRKESSEGENVVVWFATNRCRAHGVFIGARADHVSYGRCLVFVPRDRRSGSLGRSLLGRLILGDNRVRLSNVEVLQERGFWHAVCCETASLSTSDKEGLVFIHGYQTKFEDAARRTAQLKVDLAHKGPTAFFSWPSLGEAAGYTGDEAVIEGSESAIRDFLVDFAQRSGVAIVHVIAHSMGNRGLLRAMDAIAKAAASTAPIRFGQMFLAAPDVDVQLFQNLAIAYEKLAARATLYVISNDKAIGLSRRLHRFPRVGLAPPFAALPGIDTVDVSHINLGLIGHSYVPELRPVLADMHQLINSDAAPDSRFGLRRVSDEPSQHWEFVR